MIQSLFRSSRSVLIFVGLFAALGSCAPESASTGFEIPQERLDASMAFAADSKFQIDSFVAPVSAENPLKQFEDFPEYTQHRLSSKVLGEPKDLLLFYRRGGDAVALAHRVRTIVEPSCRSTEECSGVIKVSATKYSLRELTAVMSWYAGSPLYPYSQVYVESPSLDVDGQSTDLRVFVAVRRDGIETALNMMRSAGVPDDAYRLSEWIPVKPL